MELSAYIIAMTVCTSMVIPVFSASQCNSIVTNGVQYQQQYLYVANSSCLLCPLSCSSCLPTVDDVAYPCTSCQSGLGLVTNPRSPLSAGGSCSNCSSIGLKTSSGSHRLRLTPLPSAQSTSSTGVSLEGRLEVFFSGTWWSVCDDGWTLTSTNVVCRELNFGLGVTFFRQYDAWILSSTQAPSLVPEIGVGDVVCDPSDTSFFNCHFVPLAVRRPVCDRFETIGILCSGPPVNNACVADCPVGQIEAVNGQCVDCPSWLTGCLLCKANRLDSVASCIACESPLWLLQNSSVCVVECPVGQYGNASSGTCMPCRQPCRSCVFSAEKHSPSCTSCDVMGTALFDGQCVRKCPPGLLLMNSASNSTSCVTQCPAGFYGSSDLVCYPCFAECLTCFGQSWNCTACTVSNHVMLTEPISIADLSVPMTSCLSKCPSGYFMAVDERCQRCSDSRCATCYPGGIYCSSCILQSDVIELGICSANCSQGLHAVSAESGQQQSQCLPICDEGFYSDLSVGGDCKPCLTFCVQCLSSSVCMICQDGYFVDTSTVSTGQCVLQCPAQTVPFGQQSSSPASRGIRIVGGFMVLDGLVEILVMGIWGRLCASHWTIKEANVVCSQLQLGSALQEAIQLANVSTVGSSVIQQVSFNCSTGLEQTLTQCQQLSATDCMTTALVRCSGLDMASVIPHAVCTAMSSTKGCNGTSRFNCAPGVVCRNMLPGPGSFCESCPAGSYGNGSSCHPLVTSRGQLAVVYPQRAVTYIHYWPEGIDISLLCAAEQLSTLNVTWYKNGTELDNSNNWRVGPKGMLTLFTPTWQTHSGSYQCVVRDAVSFQTRSYVLSFQEAVQIISGPVDQQGIGPFLLNCNHSGNPRPTVAWMKDALMINFDEVTDMLQLPNGSLVINNGLPQYSGVYKCLVQNGYTSATASATVTIAGAPRILNTQRNFITVTGQSFSVKCLATGSPTLFIYWKKNNDRLFNDSITTVFDNGTLVITNVSDSTAGQYKCMVISSTYEPIALWNITVTVYVYPIAVINPPVAMVNVSQSVRFTCIVSGRPTPVISHWTLPNGTVVKLPQTSTNVLYSTDANSLTILSSWYADFGNISCTAASLAGRVLATGSLIVIGKPRFVRLPTDTVVFAGWPVWLPWSLSTLEQPSFAWYRNGIVFYSSTVNSSGLLLTPRCGIDTGNYTVKAVNRYGLVSASAFVQVICKYPLPTIEQIGSGFVQLSVSRSVPAQTSLTHIYFYEVWVISCADNVSQPDTSMSPVDLRQSYFTRLVSNRTHAIGTYISLVGNCTDTTCSVTVGNELSYELIKDSINVSVLNYPLMTDQTYAICVWTLVSINGSSPKLFASTNYLVLHLSSSELSTTTMTSLSWWIVLLIVLVVCTTMALSTYVCILKMGSLSAWYLKMEGGRGYRLLCLRGFRRCCQFLSTIDCPTVILHQEDDDDELASDSYYNKQSTNNLSVPPTPKELSPDASNAALYIPTEDEIERLEKLGINYYEEDDWVGKVPNGMLDVRTEDLINQQHVEERRRVITVHESMTSEERGVSLWQQLLRVLTTGKFHKHNTLDLYNNSQHTVAQQVNNSGKQFSAYHIILGKRYKISPEVGSSRSTVGNEHVDDVKRRLVFWHHWPRVSALRSRCQPLVSQLQVTAKQLHAALRRRMGRQSVDLQEAVACDRRASGDEMPTVRSIEEEEENGLQEEFRSTSRPLSVRRTEMTHDNVYVSANSLSQTDVDLHRPHYLSSPTLSTSTANESHRGVVLHTSVGDVVEDSARTTSNPCQITTAAIVHKEQFDLQQLHHLNEDNRSTSYGPSRPRRLARAVSFDDSKIRRTDKQTVDDDVILRIRTLVDSFTDQPTNHLPMHFLTIGRKKNIISRTRKRFQGDDSTSAAERTYELTELARDQRPENSSSTERAVQEVGSGKFRKESLSMEIDDSTKLDHVFQLGSLEVSTGKARPDGDRKKNVSSEIDQTVTGADEDAIQACTAPSSSYIGESDDKTTVGATTQSRSRSRNVVAVRSIDGSLENVYLSLLEITSVEDRNEQSEISNNSSQHDPQLSLNMDNSSTSTSTSTSATCEVPNIEQVGKTD